MKKKKIVIIGGGVSGLTCGIYCQKLGLKSIILEKHNIAGGNLTGWTRKGNYIDNCIHWLNGSNKDSYYNTLLKEIGAIDDTTEFNQSKYFYVSELDGKSIGVSQDLMQTQRDMIDASREDEKQIKIFIKALKYCCELIKSKHLINRIYYCLKLFSIYGRKTIFEVSKKFKTQLMQNFLTDYICGEYSIYVLLMATASFVSGDGMVPTCGSFQIAKNIAEKYKALGGQIITKNPVQDIQKNGSRIVSVKCKDGKNYTGDEFVFTCDPTVTFDKFLQNMPKNLQKTYKNRKNFPIISSFHVAYDVEMNHVDIPESFMFECNPIKIGATYYNRIMLRNYEYGKNFAPTGHIVVQIFLLQREKDYDFFANLSSTDYIKEKNRICKQLMQAILKKFPNLKNKITQIDCWTPLTYTKYFDAYKGSYMSFGITKQIRLGSVPSKITNYQNAYIATQWQVLFGGIPNAIKQGKSCAEQIAKDIN